MHASHAPRSWISTRLSRTARGALARVTTSSSGRHSTLPHSVHTKCGCADASWLPVIASNHAFDTLLPERLRFEHGDPESLAEAIRWLLEADRQALGRTLHGTVVRDHSVETWADRVVELAG